jgi:hypothetical protein
MAMSALYATLYQSNPRGGILPLAGWNAPLTAHVAPCFGIEGGVGVISFADGAVVRIEQSYVRGVDLSG